MVPLKISHYTISEQIGVGSGGVAYRAHDALLKRDVAIEVLPDGALADEDARESFRKLALSLAELHHPNIAAVYEFGSEDGKDFLVTEYITGETLDSKLASGALPVSEVMDLGFQLADGLSAAHERALVHGGVKPANLRVTSDGRLKILGFGLAQSMPQASDATVTTFETASHEVSGALPYMAPEQLYGEKADAAGDIWSAGAVLYEMATGTRPFPQENPSQLIAAILNGSPKRPNKVNPGIPADLSRIILKALTKDPKARYGSAGEMARDLGKLHSSYSLNVRSGRSWGRSRTAVAVAAVALVLITATVFFLRRHRPDIPLFSVIPHHRTVAVLGFKNISGDATKSWLSTALSEMLTTDLSEGGQLRAVPGDNVAQMKLSLALPEADNFNPKTLRRIRQNLGSDDVVVGSYLSLSEHLQLDVRLQDTKTGETVAAVSEKGSESHLDDLVSKAGDELRTQLGVAPLSQAQSAQVRATMPDNPEAARLYSQGLQDLRVFNSLAARDALEKAISLKPDYAPARAALASAWSSLGYDDKAQEQAEKALDFSSTASDEERIQIEGRSHEILKQWPEASENYQVLWKFYPDRVDYGLSLARIQLSGGQADDAEKTLAQLRALTSAEADAARINLLDATIGAARGDFERERSMAELAMQQGQSIDANLLVARTLIYQCNALERMGQPEKADQLCMQAKNLYDAGGNRGSAAAALQELGDNLFDQGKYRAARKDFEAAQAVFREIGAQRDIRNSNERIGNVLYNEGKSLESETYYKQALRYDEGIHDLAALASDYGNIANDLDDLGDLKGELELQQKSLAAFNEVGNSRGACETFYNLGNLSLETGNLAGAKKYYDQALSSATEINYRMAEPQPMTGLGDVMEARGDLVGARKQYSQALVLADQEKLQGYAATIRLSIAIVSLEEGKFSEGEALARQVVKSTDRAGGDSSGGAAWAILSRNLTAEGKLGESQAAADKAIAGSRQASGQVSHFEPNLADALVKAKTGKVEEARKELESGLAAAQKYGYRIYEYEFRLALCEIEMPSDAAAGRADLAKLETDARALGFVLIASEAHRLAI
jgi:serine/threonine protein kinase